MLPKLENQVFSLAPVLPSYKVTKRECVQRACVHGKGHILQNKLGLSKSIGF